jgi:hypothetical protein
LERGATPLHHNGTSRRPRRLSVIRFCRTATCVETASSKREFKTDNPKQGENRASTQKRQNFENR